MAPQLSRKVDRYEGNRITVASPLPYDEVLARLYGSIGRVDTSPWHQLSKGVIAKGDKEAYVRLVESVLGPHGFMIFSEHPHGTWIPMFGVGGGRRLVRIIVGNPLIAITMIRHDLAAGLSVPVELLVVEGEDRESTQLIYHLPSALIAGVNKDPELVDAAEVLDAKFAKLIDYIAI